MTFEVGSIPVIDTHEHLANIYEWKPEDVGLLHVLLENHYLMATLAASQPELAGREWNDPQEPIAPLAALRAADGRLDADSYTEALYWILDRLALVAHTSDWKSERIALSDLYGLDTFLVTRDNWRTLERRVRERYRDRDAWYEEIFKRAGIKTIFWCYGKPESAGPCRAVLNMGDFTSRTKEHVRNASVLEGEFSKWFEESYAALRPVSLKIGCAYMRDLAFAEHSRSEVESALSKILPNAAFSSSKIISDYLHALAALECEKRGLPAQVHTGYLAGNTYENPLHNTYAAKMEGFIARHSGTRFDIFHGSFPQWGEAVTLARHYPNVYLNTCWVPSTSESMAEAMLEAALDAVPVSKIMWGGDAHSPEMAYGICMMFRGIVERVLDRRDAPEDSKRNAAEWILWRSAAELFGLTI